MSNNLPFTYKGLSKDKTEKAQLRNSFPKHRTKVNKIKHSKQITKYHWQKKCYYSDLDIKKLTDSKTFWKTIKPFLSYKIVSITLIKNIE